MTLHPLTTFYNNDYGTLFALKRAEFARTVMHGGVTADRMRMTLDVPQSATHLLDVEVSLLYCSLPIHSWNSIAGTPDPGYPWVETYKTSIESSRRSRLEKAVVANASWRKAQRTKLCATCTRHRARAMKFQLSTPMSYTTYGPTPSKSKVRLRLTTVVYCRSLPIGKLRTYLQTLDNYSNSM